MVNGQGEERLTFIKEKFIQLSAKAASLKAALGVQRSHGSHFDQIAAFWRDQGVCTENEQQQQQQPQATKPFRGLIPEREEPECEPERDSIMMPMIVRREKGMSEEGSSLLHPLLGKLQSQSTATNESPYCSCCSGSDRCDSDQD